MNALNEVRAIERLFKVLDKDIQELRDQTGISCVENCIKCCTTPHIEATALEFYPLAYHLYKIDQAESILTKIEQNNNPSICPILNHLSIGGNRPGCLFYNHRGLMCRLFSYSYSTDKYGRRRMNTCKTIRMGHPEQLDKANEILGMRTLGPKASNFYSRLQIIDFYEAQRLYPIGDAVRIAIETIITNLHYKGNKAM